LSKLHRYEVLRHYIIDKLERCWSPEQIAGRLRLDRERVLLHKGTKRDIEFGQGC